ncbi:hypothetical protein [Mycolicibacterium iranicum]|uniref:hypothetical protein n=1 Tax=Mycolicibacterium iranicum TaxID=912594 RepID=UPI00046628E5|nr:hypothetical protein [Mycolicibacterium iranicum]
MTRMLLPSAFGFLMVGAAAFRADGPAVVVAAVAVAAVVASAWWRPAATVAVLLAVATVVLADSAPMHTLLAGLAAAVYLVLRHTDPTVPTMAFAVGFAVVVAVAVALPVQVAWLPLAAPLALLAGYLLALRPFLRSR